jgi:hypothetical protein
MVAAPSLYAGPSTGAGRLDPAEVARLRRETDILGLINSSSLHKIGSTGGGEYAGPCPRCGGKDRFHVQPNHSLGGRWFCRACGTDGKWGSVIDLVMFIEGVNFREACRRISGGRLQSSSSQEHPHLTIVRREDTFRAYRAPLPPQMQTAFYDYRDDTGKLAYQKVRVEPGRNGRRKEFRLRRSAPGITTPDNARDNHWITGRGELEQPLLYNLPALVAAAEPLWNNPAASVRVFVLDGEKDCDRATKDGLVAVCPPDGWGSWPHFWDGLFVGLDVVIVPDREHGSAEAAERIAAGLRRYAACLKVLGRWPNDVAA